MATNATLRIARWLRLDESEVALLDGSDVATVRERFEAKMRAWIRVIRFFVESLGQTGAAEAIAVLFVDGQKCHVHGEVDPRA